MFIKAEACTQFLDLRSNKEKGTTESASNYKPQKLSDVGENEIPGVILVQRTNTNGNEEIILEYKPKNEFDKLISEGNEEAKKYFTINEKGNLIIAKWDHTIVKVEGNYPENVNEDMKVQERDNYIITTEEIAYSDYVSEYTLPFDFLMQLLAVTEDVNFCKEVADIVLGSKIIINIKEEEKITTTTEVQTFTVHNKIEKRVDYKVEPNVESSQNYLLDKMEDDEKNRCTEYEKETTQVTVTTINTSHSYNWGIKEADTWISQYIETYYPQDTINSSNNEKIDNVGEYLEPIATTITESEEILKDEHVKEFKESKEKEYKDKIDIPKVSVKTYQSGIFSEKAYKEINISPKDKFKSNLSTYEFEQKEKTDENGVLTYYYDMPNNLQVYTISTNEIPTSITFNYQLNDSYNYKLVGTNRDELLKCNINKLEIKRFNKTDVFNDITTSIVEYPSDSNPIIKKHIYAKDSSGNFEKFLAAYNNNKDARDMINSVDEWLFEMMEENEKTSKLLNSLKYLLYIYDGTNYGVTDLDFSIFEPSQPTRTSAIYGNKLEEFIKAWENTAVWKYLNGKTPYNSSIGKYITEDKKSYIVYTEKNAEGYTYNFSYGINIGGINSSGGGYENLFKENGLSSPESYKHDGATGEVTKLDAVFADKIAIIKQDVINITSGYGLNDYQIDALTAIKYQYGNISGFKTAWTNANGNLEEFKETFWVTTASGGKTYPFMTNKYNGREKANWKIFSEGIYTDSEGNEIKAGRIGNIIDKAEEIHTYMENNGYTYGHTNGGTPEGMRNQRKVNCISFVTWVYCEAGFIDEIYISCTNFENEINSGKYKDLFQKINSYEELQPGDIMYFGESSHAEIYAGEGYSYNAGTTAAIQNDDPKYRGKYRLDNNNFKCGYRLKQ